MDLVDEYDYVGALFNLLEQGADALLKLSAILRAGDEACHVEANQTLVEEHGRRLALGDELGQPLDDGALADTRLANEDGVVLLATAENLDDALNLALASDNRIEFSV